MKLSTHDVPRTAPNFNGLHRTTELARHNLIGNSPSFRNVLDLIQRIAAFDATVLIEGETGTGKEVAARAIHYLGPRSQFPFIPINCGALPDTLVESELFGHEKGAFTDAKDRRCGLVSQADRGTLFLDEVEAMSPRAQVVLLRFLQDQKYRPVGGKLLCRANVRIIAASNAPLNELIDKNLFRRDLLFRLNVLQIRLPPLRERLGDPLILAQSFLDRFNKMYNRPPKRLHPDSIRWLDSYDWPGNIRELESLVLRTFLLTDGDEMVLPGPSLPSDPAYIGPTEATLDQPFKKAKARAVAEFEATYVRHLLEKTSGNVSLAARLSHKDRGTLNRLIRKHGLSPSDFRPRVFRGT